jgi:hypothetical protein
MYGSLWIDSRLPAELNQRSQHKTKGIVLHNDALSRDEIRVIHGVPATTPARTAFDLGRRFGRTLAVIRVDALLQAVELKLPEVESLVTGIAAFAGSCSSAKSLSLPMTARSHRRRRAPAWC